MSQVISNSVTSAFYNAFPVLPIVSTILLMALAAVIMLRKNATVKVLDIMAAGYFLIALIVIFKNMDLLPDVLRRIVEEAFGLRQAVADGLARH